MISVTMRNEAQVKKTFFLKIIQEVIKKPLALVKPYQIIFRLSMPRREDAGGINVRPWFHLMHTKYA